MTIIRYQVFPSVRLSFFSINSLISSGFPLASFHLAEPKLETGTILKNWKPLFRLPLIAKRCSGPMLSWSLNICFFVAEYFYVCSCPKISQNIFSFTFIYMFSAHFGINLFYLHNLKTQTNYATTTARTMHVNDRIQNKNKILSYSNWACFLLFDLARKQCNGIIKGLFHCLTTESKGEEFLSIIYY